MQFMHPANGVNFSAKNVQQAMSHFSVKMYVQIESEHSVAIQRGSEWIWIDSIKDSFAIGWRMTMPFQVGISNWIFSWLYGPSYVVQFTLLKTVKSEGVFAVRTFFVCLLTRFYFHLFMDIKTLIPFVCVLLHTYSYRWVYCCIYTFIYSHRSGYMVCHSFNHHKNIYIK